MKEERIGRMNLERKKLRRIYENERQNEKGKIKKEGENERIE